MDKNAQLKMMTKKISKLFFENFSDEYIVASAWSSRTSDISMSDITNILQELHK